MLIASFVSLLVLFLLFSIVGQVTVDNEKGSVLGLLFVLTLIGIPLYAITSLLFGF